MKTEKVFVTVKMGGSNGRWIQEVRASRFPPLPMYKASDNGPMTEENMPERIDERNGVKTFAVVLEN